MTLPRLAYFGLIKFAFVNNKLKITSFYRSLYFDTQIESSH